MLSTRCFNLEKNHKIKYSRGKMLHNKKWLGMVTNLNQGNSFLIEQHA
jgi:hypothetical protein